MGIDIKTVRERGTSIALHPRPGSGQHHFLPYGNGTRNGVRILCTEIKGNKFVDLQWKSREQLTRILWWKFIRKK